MASDCQEFPTESLLLDLISSFPRTWQGLFAALNVQESIAIPSGTKWLRDSSSCQSCEQKNYISPHWPDLIRSLCQLFPVILNNHVVFQTKFACFTFRIQRNMLCFIVYHSDSIPVDDIQVFVSMLVKLPQIKHYWCAALVSTLQTKTIQRETKTADIRRTRALKIPAYCISESNKTRLDNLCSKIRATSSANNGLLTAKFEPMDQDKWKNDTPGLNINDQTNLAADIMEVDAIQSEVFEISDNSPETSSCLQVKIPNPPGIKPVEIHQKSMDITSVISPTRHTSEVLNLPDDSTLHETEGILVDPSASLSSLPLSQLPNAPELEIQNIEVQLSEEDAFLNQYTQLKNHLLTCSEDLDVELQEFFDGFLENTFQALVTILTFLEISTIPEGSMIMLVKQFLLFEKECSFQATVMFAEYCIGVWLVALQQVASRNVLAVVVAFAQKHTKAFVEGVMIKQFNATSLMRPQCDLIVKVVKIFEKETLQYFLEKLLQSNEVDSRSVWNEDMILLLSTVLDRKMDLDVSIFEQFVNWIQSQSLPLASSLKFAKLVLTIINKYGSLVKTRLHSFRQILEENNTFLKKSGLTALRKLED